MPDDPPVSRPVPFPKRKIYELTIRRSRLGGYTVYVKRTGPVFQMADQVHSPVSIKWLQTILPDLLNEAHWIEPDDSSDGGLTPDDAA